MKAPPRAGTGEAGLVSAVIVNYESGKWLEVCLRSLWKQSAPVEVIVVDNGSADRSVARAVQRFPGTQVVRPDRNLGFAGGANLGAAHAQGEILLFLNPDVELAAGCLETLLAVFQDPRVGVCGPVLRVVASGTTEYGHTVDPLGYPIALTRPGMPLYVSGCALATRRTTFDTLGGFDERYFLFVEDVDYCWRALLAGWDVRVAEGALATHAGGASAPGGYPMNGKLPTTVLRVTLRERNTLTMLIKCRSAASLTWILPSYVTQSLATAALVALCGSPKTARGILSGLVWNVRELPRTLALRRSVQDARRIREREIRGRMRRTFWKAQLLLSYGIPQVRES